MHCAVLRLLLLTPQRPLETAVGSAGNVRASNSTNQQHISETKGGEGGNGGNGKKTLHPKSAADK